jgi:uncharacterized protein
MNPVLGSIYLTSTGTSVGSFDFLVSPEEGSAVEIGTPVAAETTEGVLVGTVVDMRTYGTANSPVSETLSELFSAKARDGIIEAVIATVQVFSSPHMRPAKSGLVRAANKEEMLAATGYDRMNWPIPSGVVPLADGEYAKVCLDGKALLGPESAHLIVGGVSGHAAKTSYAGVLLASAFSAGGDDGNKVAALIFNVKGDDLIWLDEEPSTGYELEESDLAMYRALGTPPRPFDDVTVYAPGLPGSQATRSNRSDALPLRWGLTEVWPYLEYILPFMGDDEKAMSFLAEFRDKKLNATNTRERIGSFDEMDKWFHGVVDEAEKNGNAMGWGNHHIATVHRMRRMLMGIVARTGGLVTRGGSSGNDIPVDKWNHGQVVVVDLAGLHADIQGLVIGRTINRLLAQAENAGLGVDHLVVFADELNTFAPKHGTENSRVKKVLQRVSTQGRYAGISLWGACQQPSKVDDLVRDNVGTRALGITADAELDSGVYGRLPGGLAERLATLPKGSMALWHYSYRGALVVRFPRPSWRTGKAKAGSVRKKVTDVLDISERSLERLTEGINAETAAIIIAEADGQEAAMEALAAARTPDMRQVALHEPRVSHEDDPFAL